MSTEVHYAGVNLESLELILLVRLKCCVGRSKQWLVLNCSVFLSLDHLLYFKQENNFEFQVQPSRKHIKNTVLLYGVEQSTILQYDIINKVASPKCKMSYLRVQRLTHIHPSQIALSSLQILNHDLPEAIIHVPLKRSGQLRGADSKSLWLLHDCSNEDV